MPPKKLDDLLKELADKWAEIPLDPWYYESNKDINEDILEQEEMDKILSEATLKSPVRVLAKDPIAKANQRLVGSPERKMG